MSELFDFTVVADTREQKPYEFSGIHDDVITDTLNTGDYAIQGLEDKFAVERKTLDDFLKSITWERDRFENEVQRAQSMLAFVVLIEATKSDVTNWNYYRDVHPNSVLATIDSWEQQYGVDFQWGRNRQESEQEAYSILLEWYNSYQGMMGEP